MFKFLLTLGIGNKDELVKKDQLAPGFCVVGNGA